MQSTFIYYSPIKMRGCLPFPSCAIGSGNYRIHTIDDNKAAQSGTKGKKVAMINFEAGCNGTRTCYEDTTTLAEVTASRLEGLDADSN